MFDYHNKPLTSTEKKLRVILELKDFGVWSLPELEDLKLKDVENIFDIWDYYDNLEQVTNKDLHRECQEEIDKAIEKLCDDYSLRICKKQSLFLRSVNFIPLTLYLN